MSQKKSHILIEYWWKHALPVLFIWPIMLFVLICFILSIFNLVSLWQVRMDIETSLASIKTEVVCQKMINTANQQPRAVNKTELNLDDSTSATSTLETIEETPEATSTSVISPSETNITDSDISPSLPLPSEPAVSQIKKETPTPVAKTEFIPPLREQIIGRLSSFGDGFSSLAYINQEKSNMFWDENVTAFSFSPVYELKKQQDCLTADCNLSRDGTYPESVCLAKGCLRQGDNQRLFFKDKELELPSVLSEQKINNITLFALEDSWLLGFISGEEAEEQGWVYRFDGRNFFPLITDETTYQIKPRYQRGGGQIAFGGSADDFLVLYPGYDGQAYRFRGDSVEDVSRFFGLRVTNGGFLAQIFKVGGGQKAVFYVCSLTENNPKIIKVWSKDTKISGGALDLSLLLFRGDWQPDNIFCAWDFENNQLNVSSSNRGADELWSFKDRGFDNSRPYQIISINLNRKTQEKVTAAALIDFDWPATLGRGNAGTQLYLANIANTWERSLPYVWHNFTRSGQSLYWRLVWPAGGDAFSSPWVDSINRLDYLFAEK